MRFSYQATNKEGRAVSGAYEAEDREALIAALTRQGLKPLLIKEGAGAQKTNFLDSIFKPKVKLRDLVMFTRQLSTLVSAGVPLPRSLSTLQQQAENKYFKEVIGNIGKDISGGTALGAAFAKYPDVFSP